MLKYMNCICCFLLFFVHTGLPDTVNSFAGIRHMPSPFKVRRQNLTLRFCFQWSPTGRESTLCFQPIYLNFPEIQSWPPERSWKDETIRDLTDRPFIWLSPGSDGTKLSSHPAPEMNDIEFCRTPDPYSLVNCFFFLLYLHFKYKQFFLSCFLDLTVYLS